MATIGPFQVALLYRDGQLTDAGHVSYALRVRGEDGEHVLHRRYSSFVELRKGMRGTVEALVGPLPALPPKSFLRKRCFCTAPRFMEERERTLQRFIRAANGADPSAEDPSWRTFLGLPVSPENSVLSTFIPGSSCSWFGSLDVPPDGLLTSSVDVPPLTCMDAIPESSIEGHLRVTSSIRHPEFLTHKDVAGQPVA